MLQNSSYIGRDCRQGVSEVRRFNEPNERKVLALAIANEEEDGRIYGDYAERLRNDYPAISVMYDDMA